MKLARALSAIALLALLASSCAADKYVVTGESLVALSSTFDATAAAMDQALDDKVITVEQYRAWRSFGEKFQQAYPLAADLWTVADATKDEKLQVQAGAALAQLAGDLGQWMLLVGVR